MNWSLTRSALKPLGRGSDGSRCRSFLAAPMKLTAVVSMDDVSVTRNGGSGFLVGMLTKLMSTAANGKRKTKKEKMPPVLLKPLKKYIPYYFVDDERLGYNWKVQVVLVWLSFMQRIIIFELFHRDKNDSELSYLNSSTKTIDDTTSLL